MDFMIRSIQTTTTTLSASNEQIYAKMETLYRKNDGWGRLLVWLPRAKAVMDASSRMEKYIDDLELEIKKGNVSGYKELWQLLPSDSVYWKVAAYCDEVLKVFDTSGWDSRCFSEYLAGEELEARERINTRFQLRGGDIKAVAGAKSWPLSYIKIDAKELVVVWLAKLKMDILTTANELVIYCDKNIAGIACDFTYWSAIATLNVTHVKSGEVVEVTAGLAEFVRAADPIINVDGFEYKQTADGSAVHRFRASRKPGKYQIPVTFSFIPRTGQNATVTKNLEYTISD